MPKTYNNLFERIYDYSNLHAAYLEARKDKRYREGVLKFSANLEENLINLQNHLMWQSYEVGEYRQTIIKIPKKRIVMILPFRDRVMQWAIYKIVNPLFERSYITDSYGCIKGRGNLKAARRLQYFMNKLARGGRDVYVAEMDIRKYFFRVPHDVIMNTLRTKIADERVMWLFDVIINSKKQSFGLPADVVDVEHAELLGDIGMPVGSLISQMLGNVVLNELDQYVKRQLCVKNYLRYMDNFDIVSNSKEELRRYMSAIEHFLNDMLYLEFSKNEISKAKNGVEFAGFRVFPHKIIVRKATTLRAKRRIKQAMKLYGEGKMSMEKAIAVFWSYYSGLLKHADNESLRQKMLDDFVLVRHSK